MNAEREAQLIELLSELQQDQQRGESIPPNVFNALLGVCPQANFEFVVCRRGDQGQTEVLLIRRPESVPSYPGYWHCPGGFIRNGDTPELVIERSRTGKMGNAIIKSIRFLNFQMYTDPHRNNATIIRLVHLVEIEGEPPTGQFFELYPTPNLPEPLVWEQPMLIQAAAMFRFQNPQ